LWKRVPLWIGPFAIDEEEFLSALVIEISRSQLRRPLGTRISWTATPRVRMGDSRREMKELLIPDPCFSQFNQRSRQASL
jgi:hypothetical protein